MANLAELCSELVEVSAKSASITYVPKRLTGRNITFQLEGCPLLAVDQVKEGELNIFLILLSILLENIFYFL